jgi:hypothetical protein
VLRIAVDIGETGKQISDPNFLWSYGIDDIARRHNLIRPYRSLKINYANIVVDEWWHFERP